MDRNRYNIELFLPDEGPLSQIAGEMGIDVNIFGIPSICIANGGRLFSCFADMRKFVRDNHIDLVHSYSPRNNVLSAAVCRFARIPCVWHERNMIYGEEVDITRRYISMPDAVICNSEAVAERFRVNGKIPSKVRVIHNGVDTRKYRPGIETGDLEKELGINNRKVVGLLGNLSERKRVRYFLEAATLVAGEMPETLFLIVGGPFGEDEDERMEELRDVVSRAGLRDNVLFTGFREDVRKYLALFDISAHVAVKEACSRAIIESMACAKPVVAMKDGGNAEIVADGDSGFLTHPADMDAFVGKLLFLLKDENARTAMGGRGREIAMRRFDVRSNADRTCGLYEELMEKKG
jgi:glycosyltransferase involved in cell wall biosynthesis